MNNRADALFLLIHFCYNCHRYEVISLKKQIRFSILSFLTFFSIGFDIYALFEGNYTSLLKLGILENAILLIGLYFYYSKVTWKKNLSISILSGLFTFFMIFGNSYMHLGNALLIFKNLYFFFLSVAMSIGYYFLFQSLLNLLFQYFDTKSKREKRFPKIFSKFESHPFFFSFLVILICWSPYIVSFSPIILSPDPSFQIKQFFGIRTKYADYAVLLDENVVLTNHHPIAHTLLLGGCLKFGRMLGSDNFGLFCYSFIQVLILVSVLSLTISYMKKMGVSSKYRFIVLLIYSLVPMFPLYAMSGVKDVLFSAFTCLYIMMIHHILSTKGEGYKIYQYLAMIVLMLLVILFRNNGLHMIILSFPLVILAVKKYWKPFLSVFLITIFCSFCYSKVILPYFHITPGSVREMLSVPFQQTARFVKFHENQVTESEKQIIDKILGYQTLAERYNPDLADPVKNQFNKYATTEDLKKYFQVWFHQFLKSPATYVDATINNVYGFFYPNKTNWYVYYKYDKRIVADGFDYHYNHLSGVRNVLSSFAVIFPSIPVLGLISNIGFSVWIILTLVGYCFYKKWYSTVCIYFPALVLILVCVVGPANTYFRYALPFIVSLPFMISCILGKHENYVLK